MKRINRLISICLLAVMIAAIMPSAVHAEADYRIQISGNMTRDGKAWQFVIPRNITGEVELNFSEYLDTLLRNMDEEGWKPGKTSSLPFAIKNESKRIYKYYDMDFVLNMYDESEDGIYYIGGKFPYKERPAGTEFRSIVRTHNDPLYALYGKERDGNLTVEEVAMAEEKIAGHGIVTVEDKSAEIPLDITTYDRYLLWYYNTFCDAQAESLMELPMRDKQNLLGYEEDGSRENFRTTEIVEAQNLSDQQMEEGIIQPRNKIIAGRSLGHEVEIKKDVDPPIVSYECVILETNPEVINLAQAVFYEQGLKFTFDDDLGKEKTDALQDEGESGWSTLCKSDLKADTLQKEELTATQASVKRALGAMRLVSDGEVVFLHPKITLCPSAVLDAHQYMGALKGMGLSMILKPVHPVQVQTKELGIRKKVEGAGLEEGRFEFGIRSDQGEGIQFEKSVARNDAKGAVDFGNITFDREGEYVVTVEEKIPEPPDKGWTFDTTKKEFLFIVREEGYGFTVEGRKKEEVAEFVNKFVSKDTKEEPHKKDDVKPKRKIKEEKPPGTGDDNHVSLYMGVGILSVVLIVIILFIKNKKS